ncbi:MAG: hypothetical protein ACRERE_22145 [Candidatus Entotheonellia bacterium]
MKRTLTSAIFVSLLILGVGFQAHLGLGDAGIVPRVQAAIPTCSLSTLRGSYGYTATGTIPNVGDLAAVGILTSDGTGQVSGADTAAASIGVIEQRTFRGTYTVNADCTGSLTLQFAALTFSGLTTADIVIVDKGRKILGIQTTPTPPAPGGVVLTLVAEQV